MMKSLLLITLAVTGCQFQPDHPTGLPGTNRQGQPIAALYNTRWVPREIASRPIATPENTQEPYLLLRPDATAEGNAGCNQFRGEATAKKADELRFGALLRTEMACPALATEEAFTTALTLTRHYRISGDTLRVYDERHGLLARLEAVYLH